MPKYIQTIEEEYSYYSRTFDILCSRYTRSSLILTVVVSGQEVEQTEPLTPGQLETEFENLKYKYLIK